MDIRRGSLETYQAEPVVQVDGSRDKVECLRTEWQGKNAEVAELRSRWKLALGQMQVCEA